ncbi:hypothetical protein U1737_13560 [Sphingomonas sp. LB3N6]|uniref:hypothetical protein n=1 Tax=Sphingomonas fucosidasi TaxID=3096164 RepID=UPI002FC7715A
MMRQPKIERTFRMREPHVRVVEIHDHDCDCAACAPYVPSDPDRLTATDMGKLAYLGAAVGSAIMFAINPAGAAAALLATISIVS